MTPAMALTTEQQVIEAIARSSRILIACQKAWSVDALATALAIKRWIEKRGGKADVAADGFVAPSHLAFLPGINAVQPDLHRAQTFVISLDLSRAGIDELSYEVGDKQLRINVIPKHGQFAPADVRGERQSFAYDLVVLVGVPDLPSLGKLFEQVPDIFHQLPTINIDYHPANERHGNIVAVDLAASSCAEAVRAILCADKAAIDENMATCLLASIIAETRSFKSLNVSTRTLETAAELIAAGGRREEIVDRLYRTKSLAGLKLWGRALSRLKFDAQTRLAWSVLVRQDFSQTGTDAEQLPDVIDEIATNSPDAETVAMLFETQNAVWGYVKMSGRFDASRLPARVAAAPQAGLQRLDFGSMALADAEKMLGQIVRDMRGRPAGSQATAAQKVAVAPMQRPTPPPSPPQPTSLQPPANEMKYAAPPPTLPTA